MSVKLIAYTQPVCDSMAIVVNVEPALGEIER